MTEDVERVALAIAAAEYPGVVVNGGWAEGTPPSYTQTCRAQAYAAIRALREPSDAVVEALADAADITTDSTAIFKAGIDAALGEGEKVG